MIRSQMLYPLSYERSHCSILHSEPSRCGLEIRGPGPYNGRGGVRQRSTQSCRPACYDVMASLARAQGHSVWIQLTRSSRLTDSSRAGWSAAICPRIIPTTWSSLSPRATNPHSHRISFTLAPPALCPMRKFALCKDPRGLVSVRPAPTARAGPEGLHSQPVLQNALWLPAQRNARILA